MKTRLHSVLHLKKKNHNHINKGMSKVFFNFFFKVLIYGTFSRSVSNTGAHDEVISQQRHKVQNDSDTSHPHAWRQRFGTRSYD